MKKTIAVIGVAEKVGSAIAYRLATRGFRVVVTDVSEKRLTSILAKLSLLLAKIRCTVPRPDIRIVLSAREASWEADIIILALLAEAEAEVAGKIKDVVTQKIIVSVINPLSKRFNDVGTARSGNSAKDLAQILPHSKIVKMFDANFPAALSRAQEAGTDAVVFVAGEDQEAVSSVTQLVKDLGLNPLITDLAAMSRMLEDSKREADGPSGRRQSKRTERPEGRKTSPKRISKP